jgi:CheY-like chemotaxis protein
MESAMDETKDVLVVDDDSEVVDAIVWALHDAGYAARSARNGAEALAAIKTRMPAVVLLDMRMPVMDGLECLRRLRTQHGRVLPVVLLTAAEHVGASAKDAGANLVLPKPFELEDLLQVISSLTSDGDGDGDGAVAPPLARKH